MNEKRFWEIDLARGAAVFLMVFFHCLFDLLFFRGINVVPQAMFWFWFPRLIASVFIFVSGMCLTFSHKRHRQRAPFTKFLKRGAKIFSLGLLITAFTILFFPSEPILFGILHLIGISSVLAYPILGFKKLNAVLGACLLIIGAFMHGLTAHAPFLFWPGLSPSGHPALDYFPLIPWFGIVLFGVSAGNCLYPGRKRFAAIPDLSGNRLLRPFFFLGRHSLIIYFLHQPILVGLLFIVFGL
jgi:uncharacterized membrane protein